MDRNQEEGMTADSINDRLGANERSQVSSDKAIAAQVFDGPGRNDYKSTEQRTTSISPEITTEDRPDNLLSMIDQQLCNINQFLRETVDVMQHETDRILGPVPEAAPNDKQVFDGVGELAVIQDRLDRIGEVCIKLKGYADRLRHI